MIELSNGKITKFCCVPGLQGMALTSEQEIAAANGMLLTKSGQLD